jgi:hypothetical protein
MGIISFINVSNKVLFLKYIQRSYCMLHKLYWLYDSDKSYFEFFNHENYVCLYLTYMMSVE